MDEAVTSNITPPRPSPGDVQMSFVTHSLQAKPTNGEVVRHCAFCLQLCNPPVKICARCKKRAYCSKECQKKDWPSTSPGQHHKNWCGIHECGEEDIDWEFVPVPGKGFGLVAKKFLQAGFKIMVDAVFDKPEDNPAAFTRDQGLSEGPNEDGSLHISRIGHSCRPNAYHVFDDGANVTVIYALQDIQPGEEIVFTHLPFTKIDEIRPNCKAKFKSLEKSIKDRESQLRKKGIVCAPDCYCKDRKVWELAREGIVLRNAYNKVVNCAEHRDIEMAIEIGEKVLDIEKRLNNSFQTQVELHFALFNLIALLKNKEILLPMALRHMEAGTKIARCIAPYAQMTLCFEKFLEDPEAALVSILRKAEDEGFSSIFLLAEDD